MPAGSEAGSYLRLIDFVYPQAKMLERLLAKIKEYCPTADFAKITKAFYFAGLLLYYSQA